MFRRLHQPRTTVSVFLDDRPFLAAAGESVAAALLAAGTGQFWAAPRRGEPRGPYCLIGHCYNCLVEIDGLPYRQACLTPVAEGMRIRLMLDGEDAP